MSSYKKGKGRRSDDTMDDDSDEKDTKRKSRNLSEKKRRDQFNLLVNELNSMVSSGGRKMDKSTILKATISFLKNHNEIAVRSRIHEIQEDWKPSFLTNEEFTHLILEAVDGFIMVFSTTGQIFYASESITSLLGHLPNELLNTTVYEIVSDEEQNNLYNTLSNLVEDKGQVSFSCYLRRGGSSPKHKYSFELVHFIGYFRSDVDMDNLYSGYSSGESQHNRLVFVGTGRLQTPQLIKEMSLVDSLKSEFTSRHSLEWKFLFLDHRAPPIIGYLPFELLGTSGYDYYHVDDLEKVTNCHEALMQKGEGTSCYYRFLTKGQQWIWLQTRFYITYHQWNSKPEFIVCTHRVVSYIDVLKQHRKEQDTSENLNIPSPTPVASNITLPWTTKSTKAHFAQEASSDCTSMSADSSASKISIVTQQSVKSRTSQGKFCNLTNNQSTQQQQFVESPQYVATIPIQPVITSFSTPAVLSPLPSIEMTREQTMLHADLQRKHAELQASIGQQQAELMMVSEQLLMTRLGLFPPQTQGTHVNVTTTYATLAGTISSTTTTASAVVPVTVVSSTVMPTEESAPPLTVVLQHETSTLYTTPDSNTSLNPTDLK